MVDVYDKMVRAMIIKYLVTKQWHIKAELWTKYYPDTKLKSKNMHNEQWWEHALDMQ